jgi:vacuolar-type H+-ATPase subunit E/Vma4
MSLESLVEEIRRRGEADVAAAQAEERAAAESIARDRDARVAHLTAESEKATQADVARERTQRLAGAKLEARKKLYEAREHRLEASVDATRKLLADLTESSDYPAVLKRMFATAQESLGKPVRVRGRAEDASLLQKVAGKSFDPTPAPIVGGLVAETADGARRLNLSFDELLRLREDRVRELLA